MSPRDIAVAVAFAVPFEIVVAALTVGGLSAMTVGGTLTVLGARPVVGRRLLIAGLLLPVAAIAYAAFLVLLVAGRD